MSDIFTARVQIESVTTAGEQSMLAVFGPDHSGPAMDVNKEWARFTPQVQLRVVVMDSVMDRMQGKRYELVLREVGEEDT